MAKSVLYNYYVTFALLVRVSSPWKLLGNERVAMVTGERFQRKREATLCLFPECELATSCYVELCLNFESNCFIEINCHKLELNFVINVVSSTELTQRLFGI